MAERIAPDSFDAVSAVLAGAAAAGRRVRITGAGTKHGWGGVVRESPDIILSTLGLDRIDGHDPSNRTATIGAGVRLETLQAELYASGQMLALDPPNADSATVGGIFATGDSGPLRHRFGTPRDQILGVCVALSDGSVARSGAGVLRNVAGYDLARLFCGSFGTLGAILSVTVRLQPLPERTATALGLSDNPGTLAAAVAALVASPLELRAIDVAWRRGRGGLLVQVGAVDARRRAGRVAALMGQAGMAGVEVAEHDTELWARQRSGQRSSARALVRVSARPSRLPEILALADVCAATVVGRAAAGISYLELELNRVPELRLGLPRGSHAVLLDRPTGAPATAGGDPWGTIDAPALAVMRTLKASFDPAGVCNRGIYVGGI